MKEIESVLQEERRIQASKNFTQQARISSESEYQKLHQASLEDPDRFWSEQASELYWSKKWSKVLEWTLPHAKWFVGGETNLSYNCLDRHVEDGFGDKKALIFESESGDSTTLTYSELLDRVSRFAALLKNEGIIKGDRVAIYMPLIPDAIVSMLACARIGAIHTVVFGGFSAQALSERIQFSEAKAVITSFGGSRRGKNIPLKNAVDEAVKTCPSIQKVFVFAWPEAQKLNGSKEILVDDALKNISEGADAEFVESNHPSFVLFTSGSTGKPKGILHGTGGYMLYTYLTSKYVFDIKENDLYWCTADVGWITGHSYLTYGPLLNRATCFLYEGAPDFPKPNRFWEMIDRHKVTILYTAPTAIRAFMKWGLQWVKEAKLSSLRLLGTVGEPINPEAWTWYYENIGKSKCPVVDTWWQTETGGVMITTMPGVHWMRPGSAGLPMFGVDAAIVNHDGEEVPDGEGGFLVLKRPWPGMMQTIYGDDERFKDQYWNKVSGVYFAGDGARKDQDGRFWIMGRIDDVINVSGHRLGTMEIESALVAHPSVAEAAVIGVPDEIKGESVVAFVSLESSVQKSDGLEAELKEQVQKEIGAIAKPSKIQFTQSLPKTRSGKIMRRLLRSIATGDTSNQDMSTLEDAKVLESLRAGD